MDLFNKFRKYNILIQILIFLIIIFLLKLLFNKLNYKEQFTNINLTFKDYDNSNLFDKFYSEIYDKLHNDNDKNNNIIEIIQNKTKIKDTSSILDIGCGTGEIVSKLSNFNILGIDKSPNMINICKNKFPNSKFDTKDILNNNNFDYNLRFTHILCLNYTIYYIKDRNSFFKNCTNLIMPNGILVLHLVESNKFNRTINACKINNFNPAKYLENKSIRSNINFDNFNYKCNYQIDTNTSKGIMDETFEFKNKSIRKNSHTLNLDNYKIILEEAKREGFIIEGQIKMKNNDGEYIFILKKNL